MKKLKTTRWVSAQQRAECQQTRAYCTAHSPSLALPTPRPDELFWLMLVGMVTCIPCDAGTIAGAVFALCTKPNWPLLICCWPAAFLTTIAPSATSRCSPFAGGWPLTVGTPPQSLVFAQNGETVHASHVPHDQ